jgi:hypothetical protein
MAEARTDDQQNPKTRKRIAEYLGSADFWTALATILLVVVGVVGVKITIKTLELAAIMHHPALFFGCIEQTSATNPMA